MKSAIGISSLTSGFTIWSSNGCDWLLSSIAVISERSLSGSSTSALASFFASNASWLPPGRLTRSIACCKTSELTN